MDIKTYLLNELNTLIKGVKENPKSSMVCFIGGFILGALIF